MSETNKTLLFGLGSALLVGLLAALLFSERGFGINVPIILGSAVLLMIVGLKKWRPSFVTNDFLALCGAAVFFACMYAWFDSKPLRALDVLAMITIVGLMSLPALKRGFQNSGVTAYVGSLVNAAFWSMFGALFFVMGDFRWKEFKNAGVSSALLPIGKGLIVAAPVIFVIGAFLVAADEAFSKLVFETFRIEQSPELVLRLFIFGIVGYIALGLFRSVLFGMEIGDSITTVSKDLRSRDAMDMIRANKRAGDSYEAASLGVTEISIVLGLMNVVFAVFVFLQLPYLFGGMELVQSTADFKLADYARRGVTELIMVTGFVISVLLFLHWTIDKKNELAAKLFRWLSVVQIGLLFVVLASAVQRVLILTGPLGYGMTQIRFYGMIGVIWIALILIWFGVTVLRNHRHHFAFGALWTSLFVIAVLHFVNPEAFIAQRNIELMEQGREFDAEYHVDYLSADAVPVLLNNRNKMSFKDRELILETLKFKVRKGYEFDDEAASWTYSRSQARKMIAEVSNKK